MIMFDGHILSSLAKLLMLFWAGLYIFWHIHRRQSDQNLNVSRRIRTRCSCKLNSFCYWMPVHHRILKNLRMMNDFDLWNCTNLYDCPTVCIYIRRLMWAAFLLISSLLIQLYASNKCHTFCGMKCYRTKVRQKYIY